MEENQEYRSLSFFKVLVDSSASKISIPPNFIRKFGERIEGNCKLEANGKWYNVKCEKIDTMFYFTQGWLSFVEANGLECGYFLTFNSMRETSSFSVLVFDSSQTGVNRQRLPGSFPASDNRARVKEEPIECPAEDSPPGPVPASNKRARVKEERSLTPSRSEKSSETDSEKSSKPHVKSENEDGDDLDKGHKDFRGPTFSSLSFSATFKGDNWVAIPKDFAEKTGIENHRRVMLEDNTGKRWPIDLKPIKGGKMKLTNGWKIFKRALRVDANVTCIFESKGRSSNVLKVLVRRGRGRPRNQ